MPPSRLPVYSGEALPENVAGDTEALVAVLQNALAERYPTVATRGSDSDPDPCRRRVFVMALCDRWRSMRRRSAPQLLSKNYLIFLTDITTSVW